MMKEKVDIYFKLLHPEYETLTDGEQLRVMEDQIFIQEHIAEIDEMYTTYISKAERIGKKTNKQEILARVVGLKKADKYFEILHPEYETLTDGEQLRLMEDKIFIQEHIAEIDGMYTTYISKAERIGKKINKQEILARVVGLKKADKYFEILHPEYETLTDGEQLRAMEDKTFIQEHIAEIDREYPELMAYYGAPEGDPQVMQDVINNIKRVEAIRQKISVQKIGQATINTPTTAKEEAEQVENEEITRDNIKEGEEPGDDN